MSQRARRVAFLLLAAGIAAALLLLLLRVLAPGGCTGWEWLILLAYLGTLPWTALSAGNALVGLPRLLRPTVPAPPPPPTRGGAVALAVCLRHEDPAALLPPLAALLDGLEAAGAGGDFALWLLSDSDDPALAAAEAAALDAFAAERARPLPGVAPGVTRVPVRWRRRTERDGFKAGNLMQFLDRHAGAAEYVLCLDADSAMTAGAVLRLRAAMDAEPGLAILQPLIAGRPTDSAFPRLYQFGMRAGMRAWGAGQDWWQGDEGPYWGHNALIRVAPFRQHARLAPLPDGSAILSHDQVEAVQLHAAGWGVRLLPDDRGSAEASPPAMPEFLARDRRWGRGNLQYFALLRRPGLRPMGRWQLLQAILLFASAPLWLLLLLLALGNAWSGGGAAVPGGALLALLAATWGAYLAPKLCGYAAVLLRAEAAAAFGGRARFAAGAATELLFFQLFEPVAVLNKALTVLAMPLGRPGGEPRVWLGVRWGVLGRGLLDASDALAVLLAAVLWPLRALLQPFRDGGWAAQNRDARGVGWREAAALLWPIVLLAGASLLLLGAHAPASAAWALLFLAGPLLAVPLCVLTADPRLGQWLRRRGLAAMPEELGAARPSCPAVAPPNRTA